MKSLLILYISLTYTALNFAYGNTATKEVLLANSAVEVIRLTYPVATESGFHTHQHPNRVLYVIQGGTLALLTEGKENEVQVIKLSAGKALFLPSVRHNVKNIGSTEVVIIETEIKK